MVEDGGRRDLFVPTAEGQSPWHERSVKHCHVLLLLPFPTDAFTLHASETAARTSLQCSSDIESFMAEEAHLDQDDTCVFGHQLRVVSSQVLAHDIMQLCTPKADSASFCSDSASAQLGSLVATCKLRSCARHPDEMSCLQVLETCRALQ